MKLALYEYDLPLRHTFTIARGSTDVQRTLIAVLDDGAHRGYGEATVNDYYGATVERMAAALAGVRDALAHGTLDDPAALWQQLDPQLSDCRFAQCALDLAAHDLWGKRRCEPLWRLWGLSLENLPKSNYTIGIDRTEVMVARLREMPGWPAYKIKLGTDRDLEIVKALRAETNAALRVDANCGWTAEQAIAMSMELAGMNVEFIEQPLPADEWGAMERVYDESALEVIADESCIIESDVDRCAGCFHGVNVKLVKCGGLTPARRMIARARQLGLKAMVGCMTESTVGISAIAQLLPLLDYVDMDGAVLLAQDIARGVRVELGRCIYPDVPGCGVELTEVGRRVL